MAFRYMNPGYINLIEVVNSSSIAQVDATGKSYTGSAFTNGNGYNVVSVPADDEFWAKCELYIANSGGLQIGEFYTGTLRTGASFNLDTSGASLYLHRNNSSSSRVASGLSNVGVRTNAINSFWIHVKYGDSSTAFVEAKINHKSFKIDGAVIAKCSNPINLGFYSYSSPISGIIISDEEISPRERLVPLPISVIETDMTAGASGIYVADDLGQTLLQSPDIFSLVENYGASSAITGVAVLGNPAYKTGSAMTTLTGITKAGSSIIEHGSCELYEDDLSAMVMDTWGLSGVTISDLQNMQFGWKAGM